MAAKPRCDRWNERPPSDAILRCCFGSIAAKPRRDLVLRLARCSSPAASSYRRRLRGDPKSILGDRQRLCDGRLLAPAVLVCRRVFVICTTLSPCCDRLVVVCHYSSWIYASINTNTGSTVPVSSLPWANRPNELINDSCRWGLFEAVLPGLRGFSRGKWSERQDLNLRRLAPKASALARLSYAPARLHILMNWRRRNSNLIKNQFAIRHPNLQNTVSNV
jgi:hypothetical protein